MPLRLSAGDASFESAFDRLLSAKRDEEANVAGQVSAILKAVRERGDDAVLEFTARFDRLTLSADEMRVPPERVAEAVEACKPETRDALRTAATRIEAYHRRMLPEDFEFTDEAGVRLGARWSPIDSVGIYVPGGRAAYPSSALMNGLPAKVAGVPRIVMVVPTPDGALNDDVLTAAHIAGVSEIYRIGGAQAVAALAFGTRTVAPVDKIVGPGNAYVAEAKRQVFGTVGIDLIAGPSEILVVADGENDPHWVATDLLSQAEHDPAAQAVLITDDAGFADRVLEQVESLLQGLPRGDIARESWDAHGAIILVPTLDDAVSLINRIAPEHLELAVAEPDRLAREVRHAGAIFLGRHTPEAIGDYVAGPNHVLPTSQSARFSSGLGVLDFLKRTSMIGCDLSALAKIGPAAVSLARAEGLEAHARSVALRLDAAEDDG